MGVFNGAGLVWPLCPKGFGRVCGASPRTNKKGRSDLMSLRPFALGSGFYVNERG